MAPERFDDLARLLATASSRRQILKILAGSTASLILAGLKADRLSAAPKPSPSNVAPPPQPPALVLGAPATITPLQARSKEGTCEGFAATVSVLGVVDDQGYQPMPPAQGLTEPVFGANWEYKSNTSKNGTCLKASKVQVTFTAGNVAGVAGPIKVFALDWTPCPSNSLACGAEVTRWQRDIALHEGWHVNDAYDLVTKVNQWWAANDPLSKKTYQACGSDPVEKQIDDLILNDLTPQLKSIYDTYEIHLQRTSQRYRRSPNPITPL